MGRTLRGHHRGRHRTTLVPVTGATDHTLSCSRGTDEPYTEETQSSPDRHGWLEHRVKFAREN